MFELFGNIRLPYPHLKHHRLFNNSSHGTVSTPSSPLATDRHRFVSAPPHCSTVNLSVDVTCSKRHSRSAFTELNLRFSESLHSFLIQIFNLELNLASLLKPSKIFLVISHIWVNWKEKGLTDRDMCGDCRVGSRVGGGGRRYGGINGNRKNTIKNELLPWPVRLHWVLSTKRKIICSIPGQGTCLGCGFSGTPSQVCRTNRHFSHTDISLPLFLPPYLLSK